MPQKDMDGESSRSSPKMIRPHWCIMWSPLVLYDIFFVCVAQIKKHTRLPWVAPEPRTLNRTPPGRHGASFIFFQAHLDNSPSVSFCRILIFQKKRQFRHFQRFFRLFFTKIHEIFTKYAKIHELCEKNSRNRWFRLLRKFTKCAKKDTGAE